jgi:8-oxo-dGTP pyrophosphatase MutT (NUDIX family)
MSLLAPHLADFPIVREDFREAHPDITDIIVGAFIIAPSATNREKTISPRVLLLRRSMRTPPDQYPGTWDFPGGRFETSDETMVDAVKREVFEETGLHVSQITAFVGISYWTKPKYPARKWGKFCFIVEAEEQKDVAGFDLKSIPIKLSPDEHDDFYWATEEEVKDGPLAGNGPFVFIGKDGGKLVSQSFSNL